MVELGARCHIGRVRTVVMLIHRPVYQAARSRSVCVSLRRVVRPAVVPTNTRCIAWIIRIAIIVTLVIIRVAKISPCAHIGTALPPYSSAWHGIVAT